MKLCSRCQVPCYTAGSDWPPGEEAAKVWEVGGLGGWSVGGVQLDIHSLVKVIGDSKAASRARARGRQTSDRELGALIAQTRRYLSVAFTRAQGLCLLNRLGFLGEGARAAAGRRVLAQNIEAKRQRDLQAHYMAHVRGQGLSRVGQVFVP